MKKVLVIGCPGSGKSTFARALQAVTGLPLHHLDLLYWNADGTTVGRPAFLKRLQEVMGNDSWIIDGNYPSTLSLRLWQSDTVFFLDYGPEVCMEGIRTRRQGERKDMPFVPSERDDRELVAKVKGFAVHSRPRIIDELSHQEDVDVITFTCREEADRYLAGLC